MNAPQEPVNPAAALANLRWQKLNPDQRKAATEKARQARKANAAKRRAAKNGGGDTND